MGCLICNSEESKEIFREDGIAIRRCKNCGHVYSSFAGEESYAGYFPEDVARQDHHWWREAHARMYGCFRRRFLTAKKGCLLDCGCGLGYFLDSVRHDRDTQEWEAYGAETSEPAADFASHKLGLPRIFNGSAAKAAYPEKNFDLITMWDVLEHLPDPRPVLSDLYRSLKAGGCIFISTPNINIQLPKAHLKKLFFRGRTRHYLEARDHLHDYSPRSLRRLLESCGFRRVVFMQLPPITSVSGSRSHLLVWLKEAWYQAARLVFVLSAGRINLNNLYALAYKE